MRTVAAKVMTRPGNVSGSLPRPILDPQTRNIAKVLLIAGDKDKVERQGLDSNRSKLFRFTPMSLMTVPYILAAA